MAIATRAAEARWDAAVSEASSLCPVSRLFAGRKSRSMPCWSPHRDQSAWCALSGLDR